MKGKTAATGMTTAAVIAAIMAVKLCVKINPAQQSAATCCKRAFGYHLSSLRPCSQDGEPCDQRQPQECDKFRQRTPHKQIVEAVRKHQEKHHAEKGRNCTYPETQQCVHAHG